MNIFLGGEELPLSKMLHSNIHLKYSLLLIGFQELLSEKALQYSCLENPMDGGAWQAAVHGVAKSQTRLSDLLSLFTFMYQRRKWQPTPVFLPGESQGPGSLVGCRLWGRTESDTTEATQQQQQELLDEFHKQECAYLFVLTSHFCHHDIFDLYMSIEFIVNKCTEHL